MNRFNRVISTVVVVLAFVSCKNQPETRHENALPHNLGQTGELTSDETKQLANARGISATPIQPADLTTKIMADTSTLLVVYFWKLDCETCAGLQKRLQNVRLQLGENKLNIFAVNLDGPAATEAVNIRLRTAGFTMETFLLLPEEADWMKNFDREWHGETPALFLKNGDGLQQFYKQDFSQNELMALFQPLVY